MGNDRSGARDKRSLIILVVILVIFLFVLGVIIMGTVVNEENNEASSQQASESGDYAEESFETETSEEALPNPVGVGEMVNEDIMSEALMGEEAVTTFIGESFYDGLVKNDEDAAEAIYSVMDRIGGDETTQLGRVIISGNVDGGTYYTFQQVVGDISVYGAAIKVLVDKDGKTAGLVSAVIPGLDPGYSDDWQIDGTQAEEIVKKEYEDEKLDIDSAYTQRVLLPLEDTGRYYYAWGVCSNNYYNGVDTAYLMHYVSSGGEYLYCIPLSNPESNEIYSGTHVEYDFDGMKAETWTGTVTSNNGETQEISVPYMVDPSTGDMVLGDQERKILCADYADYTNDEIITPIVAEDGKWEDVYLIIYYNYISCYDLYKSAGWEGPDGARSPSLILMDAVNEDGTPMENACYAGFSGGFQKFLFDTENHFGEAMDVVGHEFTHCVTSTTMTTNIYMNDYGAINEGMSDIMGNLVAIECDATDKPFIMGDKQPELGVRSMIHPNESKQPVFVWDRYYVPAAANGTDSNDNGGVHCNSSFLNNISYKLDQAGMATEDQFYYWLNVADAMTPRTDYPQLMQILPWIMKNLGYDKYLDALNKAIDDTKLLEDRSVPEQPPEGYSMLEFQIPENVISDDYDVTAGIVDLSEEDGDTDTYPEAGDNIVASTLPPGEYIFVLTIANLDTGEKMYAIPAKTGWELTDEAGLESMTAEMVIGDDHILTLKKGEKLVLDSESFVTALDGKFADK
ncbi:MAG: M4 family metallopeptidase [Lachnospiraceae bacterium]|nr:M4 family metallopeptidase [Lachnospiraceae bacterium]